MIKAFRAANVAALVWLVLRVWRLQRENDELWVQNDELDEWNRQLVERVRKPLIP